MKPAKKQQISDEVFLHIAFATVSMFKRVPHQHCYTRARR